MTLLMSDSPGHASETPTEPRAQRFSRSDPAIACFTQGVRILRGNGRVAPQKTLRSRLCGRSGGFFFG